MAGARLATAACAAALCVSASVALAGSPSPGAGGKLPPGTLHGPAVRLQQYPTISLATPAQHAAAVRLWAAMRREAAAWRTPAGAAAAGFSLKTAPRAAGDVSPHYLHAEHRGFRKDSEYLNPSGPETLVFANSPGRPLVLIGVMFSMPRGIHGPTPGGPITRWHTHRVCIQGKKRGRQALPDGSCPAGAHPRQGSEMLHVWFTRDLRSAFAIHAPEPELCTIGKLPAGWCHGQHFHHQHV